MRDVRLVFGNALSQARLKKAMSIRSSVVRSRLLDRVKRRSVRGGSRSARLSMVLLNKVASDGWKCGLFFSLVNLMRLKSPTTSHGTVGSAGICCNSSRKSGFKKSDSLKQSMSKS